ncbi:MAG TPA: response regulator [Rectinemataceae bacterium]|nr:response regulator [Rectinemataceae bacterium]
MGKSGKKRKTATILAIEDSPTQLESLRFLLDGAGFSVVAATNGEEGLAAAAANAIDLVISDILMPKMDGYAFCKALRADESLHGIPVILLTSLADPRDVIQGLESGANNFICKPYDDDILLARIQNVLLNQEIRKASPSEMGISIYFSGQRFFITADRLQILDLLLSTYENAVDRNTQLTRTRDELRNLNEELERRVAERTAALAAEVAERKLGEEREHKLNMTLHALHDSNQIITREKDPALLAKRVCAILVEKRGYARVEISLEGRKGQAPMAAKKVRDETAEGEPFIVDIHYGDEEFGELEIRPDSNAPIDEEENSFILEVAGELGLALHLIAIERRNAAYTQIVENNYDAIALVDPNDIYEEVNPAYMRLVNLDRDAIVGRSLKEILGPEFLQLIRPILDRSFKGEVVRFEIPWTLPDGGMMHIDAQLSPCHSEDGSVFAAVVTLRDATERKRAEKSIQGQLEELQRWQNLMLDREDRTQELKREVNELCRLRGEALRYPSQTLDPADVGTAGKGP